MKCALERPPALLKAQLASPSQPNLSRHLSCESQHVDRRSKTPCKSNLGSLPLPWELRICTTDPGQRNLQHPRNRQTRHPSYASTTYFVISLIQRGPTLQSLQTHSRGYTFPAVQARKPSSATTHATPDSFPRSAMAFLELPQSHARTGIVTYSYCPRFRESSPGVPGGLRAYAQSSSDTRLMG